jgi:hypothetical protein
MFEAQRVEKPIIPGADDFLDSRFQLFHVGVGPFARIAAYDVVHARDRFIVEHRHCRGFAAIEGLRQEAMNLLAHLTAVTFARNEGENRHVPIEAVEAQEQPHFWPLTKIEDAECGRQQFVFRNLEQFVPREAVQDMLQRFAVMARRRQTRTCHNLRHLATQQRDIRGQKAVGV